MKSVGILGTGIALPDKIMTNAELEKIVETTEEWIVTRTGIRERRVAELNEFNSDFATLAGQNAIADAGISPDEIDLVLVATVTGDKLFPATANIVQGKLGLTKAGSFDLNGACSGFVYALIVAEGMIISGACRKILLIGSEVMSRILDWTDRNTCVLFGDGAGAVVLGEVESGRGILSRYIRSEGKLAELLHMPAGGTNIRITPEVLDRRENFVKMSGNEVFKFAVKYMGESAIKAVTDAGLTTDQIDLMIPHQANIRIIEATAKRLGLPRDKVFVNIDKYGNTTAASIPLAIHEARQAGRLKKGDNLLIVAFGAGFTWGSALIRM